jgi:hypothetical protein
MTTASEFVSSVSGTSRVGSCCSAFHSWRLLAEYWGIPTAAILGHRETGANKAFPTMDEQLVRGSVARIRSQLALELRSGGLTPWSSVALVRHYVAGFDRLDATVSGALPKLIATSL